MSAVVLMMAWQWTGHQLLSKPKLSQSLDAYIIVSPGQEVPWHQQYDNIICKIDNFLFSLPLKINLTSAPWNFCMAKGKKRRFHLHHSTFTGIIIILIPWEKSTFPDISSLARKLFDSIFFQNKHQNVVYLRRIYQLNHIWFLAKLAALGLLTSIKYENSTKCEQNQLVW